MLQLLSITNYALIERLSLAPGSGLNIITGETGAGKSILLGALGLIAGERADTKVVADETQKCVVEATFQLNPIAWQARFEALDLDFAEETIIRREILPTGKSRAFVNDTPATLEAIRALADDLLDIHSQHDTLLLGNQTYQLRLLDEYGDLLSLASQVATAFRVWRQAKEHLAQLSLESSAAAKEQDFISYLYEELQAAKLNDTQELDKLETELNQLGHAEEILEKLASVANQLNTGELNASDLLKSSLVNLDKLAQFGPHFDELRNRLKSVAIELTDISNEIDAQAERIELNPERLEEVKARVDELNHLCKKHQAKNLEELIKVREELSSRLRSLLNLEDDILAAQEALNESEQAFRQLAERLSLARQQVAPTLAQWVIQTLASLGMDNAQFQVLLETKEPSPTGTESIQFLFTANKGSKLQALKDVASGGEFSRLMLALKYALAQRVALPLLVLDEIDTGISGQAAKQVAELLQNMAQHHQMLAITHLPSIAAKGSQHFHVFKDHTGTKTKSSIRQLSPEERVETLATMISGDNFGPDALKTAQSLLQ